MEHEPQSDCTLIRTELVLYHFGEVETGTRVAIERHLPACVECVRAFLAVKRELETSPAAGPVPSELARARLKAAVLLEIARPVPAWQSRFQTGALAAAAALLAVVLVFAALDSKKTPSLGSAVHIDSARPATPGLDLL